MGARRFDVDHGRAPELPQTTTPDVGLPSPGLFPGGPVRGRRVLERRVALPFCSTTDGGKKAVVIAQIVRDDDGVRPITAWGGGMMSEFENMSQIDDADWGEPVPVTVGRNVTISVRFSAEEIEAIRQQAKRRA